VSVVTESVDVVPRHQRGGCRPGELSHSLMCEPVSA
jgi:hypothetical protein